MGQKQDHKIWRKQFNEKCLKRDGNKCRFCSETENLEVHHITSRKTIPNAGYTESNGITLCQKHHWMAEQFHMTGESLPGFSPDELYREISSSYEKAYEDSLNLNR